MPAMETAEFETDLSLFKYDNLEQLPPEYRDLEAEERTERTGRSRSRKQVVLDGLEELDEPTRTELVEYAVTAGIEESAVERLLEKLHRAGKVMRTDCGYRKL